MQRAPVGSVAFESLVRQQLFPQLFPARCFLAHFTWTSQPRYYLKNYTNTRWFVHGRWGPCTLLFEATNRWGLSSMWQKCKSSQPVGWPNKVMLDFRTAADKISGRDFQTKLLYNLILFLRLNLFSRKTEFTSFFICLLITVFFFPE